MGCRLWGRTESDPTGVTQQQQQQHAFSGSVLPEGSPGGSVVKNPPASAGGAGVTLGWEEPLEKEMATHSSILAWRIPWAEEAGRLQSTGHKQLEKMEQLSTERFYGPGTENEGVAKTDRNPRACAAYIAAVEDRQQTIVKHTSTRQSMLEGDVLG